MTDDDLAGFIKIVEEKTHLLEFSALAPRLFLMGIVSTYDGFLTNLISDFFRANPGAISASDKSLTYREIIELGDLDAAKDHILEKEVEAVIRESHIYNFEWLEKKLAIPLRKELSSWPKFVEVCERRNLFTHTNGRVSRQYMEICQKHRADIKGIRRGQVLKVTGQYFQESLDTFFEIGVKLGHVIWRKSTRDDTLEADKNLSNICYGLIEAGRYALACNMLDFAVAMPGLANDEIRRIMIVNRANAYKLSGHPAESLKILDAEDWSATGIQFKISVAAIREDVEEVVKMMEVVGPNGSVSKDSYLSWPVFENVRKSEAFKAKFESIFGVPPLPQTHRPMLLEVAAGADRRDFS